ncbi:MAG: biotin/lipoyl-containing protein, partial [Chthoniobacterales bacterium]
MSLEVKIPAVGESITSGVVSVWHKKSGEQVRAGEPLFTLETDKVSTEIVAERSGVLKTLAAEGQEVKIGEVVATIDESGAVASLEKTKEKPKSSDTKSPNAEVLA